MTPPEVQTITMEQYVSVLNGKIAGIRLSLSLLITKSQSPEVVREYVDSLKRSKSLFEEVVKGDEDQPESTRFLDGTIEILDGLIETLDASQPEKQE